MRFISDFRELNKTIKNKPFPTPKILDLLLILEGFRSAISSDLTIRYYHITLYLVFISLKSEINLTVPFFLGIIKVGAAHWELLIFFNTPILINLLTSFSRVSLWILGVGKGFAW